MHVAYLPVRCSLSGPVTCNLQIMIVIKSATFGNSSYGFSLACIHSKKKKKKKTLRGDDELHLIAFDRLLGIVGRNRQGGGIDRACKLPVGDKDAILGYVRQGRVGHGYCMRKLSIRCTIGVCGYGKCRVWARHWRGLGVTCI